MVERLQVKRAGQRTSQRRFTPSRVNQRQTQQQGTFLRSQTAKAIDIKQKQTLANKYDTFFNESQFGTIQQIEEEYAKIDTNVKQYMKYNPSIAREDLSNRISSIQNSIKTSNEKEARYDKKDNRPSELGERARQQGLKEGLKRLQNGELLSTSSITKYASKLRSNARSRARDKERRKEAKAKLEAAKPKAPSYKTQFIIKTKSGKTYNTNNPNFKPKGETITQTTTNFGADAIAKQKQAIGREIVKLKAVKDTAFVEAQKGNFDIRKLTTSGLNSAEVTQLQRVAELARMNKLEQQNTDKFWNEFNKQTLTQRAVARTKPSSLRSADQFSQEQAFKISANQYIQSTGGKPLDFNTSVSKFNAKLDKIDKAIKLIKIGKVPKPVSFRTITDLDRITQKKLLGISVSTKEEKAYNAAIKAKGTKSIEKKQYDLGMKIILSPINYGRGLRKRFEGGENNPLFNDITNFGKGFKTTTIDFAIDLANVVWKGSSFTVKKAFNYGKRIQSEAQKGNFVIDDDIAKVGKVILKGTKTTAQQANKLKNFVVNNPKKAAIITGAAAGTGFVFVGTTGKKISKLTYTAYTKSPSFFLGQVFGLVLGGKIIGGVAKGVKGIAQSKVLRNILYSQKFSSNKFKVTTDLAKGFSKVKGTTKGTFLNGQKFTTKYRLTINTKLKETNISGQLVTKVGKKTFVEKITLFDKGSYYLDPVTKARIPKIRAPIKSRSITLKETKFTPDISTATKEFTREGVLKTVEGDFITTVTRIIDKTKKITIREGKLYTGSLTKGNKKKILDLSNQFIKRVGKTKRTTFQKPLTKSEIKFLKEFVDQVGIKNLSGLDRRRKIAKALGVTKTSPNMKPIEDILDKSFRVKATIIRKGKVVLKGQIITKPKPKIKFQIKTRKLSDLRKNKKAQLSLVKNDRIQILRKTKTKIKTPRFIEVPALKSKIPLTKGSLKAFGVLSKTTQLLRKVTVLGELYKLYLTQEIKETQLVDQIKKIRSDVKEINKKIIESQIKIEKQLKKGKTATTQIEKQLQLPLLKQITKITKVTKGVPRITGKVTPPTKPPKIPKVKIPSFPSKNFYSSAYKNIVAIYQGVYRERKNRNKPSSKRNKVITKTINLRTTRNRALNKLAKLADNRTVRSIQVKIIKITNKKLKDVKLDKTLNKFNRKKSKNTPVLKLVEKSKHIADTKGEIRELKITKQKKKSTQPKKVIKKAIKKSSPKKSNKSKKVVKKKAQVKKKTNKKSSTAQKSSQKRNKKKSGSKRAAQKNKPKKKNKKKKKSNKKTKKK